VPPRRRGHLTPTAAPPQTPAQDVTKERIHTSNIGVSGPGPRIGVLSRSSASLRCRLALKVYIETRSLKTTSPDMPPEPPLLRRATCSKDAQSPSPDGTNMTCGPSPRCSQYHSMPPVLCVYRRTDCTLNPRRRPECSVRSVLSLAAYACRAYQANGYRHPRVLRQRRSPASRSPIPRTEISTTTANPFS
jgi:hypothetical protein